MLDRDEMARWQRLTAAMLATAATDDPAGFAQVVTVLDRARELLPAVVWQLRTRASASGGDKLDGYSWQDIADELHVTRSAAAQRFGAERAPDLSGVGDVALNVKFKAWISRP